MRGKHNKMRQKLFLMNVPSPKLTKAFFLIFIFIIIIIIIITIIITIIIIIIILSY